MTRIRHAWLLLCAILLTSAAPVYGQASSSQGGETDKRKQARELANAGGKLYQKEQYAEAFEKLDAAYALLPVPTLAFWSARCLQELGRWVEASERFDKASKLPIPDENPGPHEKARADALRAMQSLQTRIPQLRVLLPDDDVAKVSFTVDDQPVETKQLVAGLQLNPGPHRLVANQGGQTVERQVTLVAARELQLEISFRKPESATAPPRQVVLQPLPPSKADEADPGAEQRIAGWVGIGVGGAAVVAGAATGIVLLVQDGSLDDTCSGDTCASGADGGDVDTYNAMRLPTTVLLAAGGALAVTGAVLVLTAPSTEGSETALELRIGPTHLGLSGRF